MTRKNLGPPNDNTPTESRRQPVDEPALILQFAAVVEQLAAVTELLAVRQAAVDPEIQCFTPEEAAKALRKTENWVVENIQQGRIPHTYIGKSPRMTAAHIRWVQSQGERVPHKYAKPVAA
ncbi:helix-turn-helix domain-containing protein [Streptomyces sp. bgisy022]|uniref:helix-turn-helix domain-containing protein n=1 Tax=Streptomyces sp. bgisy022 TaxID=3413769 RepID=UPI003D75D495